MAAGALAAGGVVALCVSRARRLDRLHVRMDAARAGLALALERRWQAAAQVPDAGVRAAVRAARTAGRDREVAENALSRALAGLAGAELEGAGLDRTGLDRAGLDGGPGPDEGPGPVGAELLEAGQLLALARRVYNDAVRDTLALRARRLVRWLHLAGTAPMPAYFEIADGPDVTDAAVARTRERQVASPGLT